MELTLQQAMMLGVIYQQVVTVDMAFQEAIITEWTFRK